jgi:hypothetical protein
VQEFPQAASVTEWDVSNGVRIYGNDKITLLVSDFQLGSSADNVTRVYGSPPLSSPLPPALSPLASKHR